MRAVCGWMVLAGILVVAGGCAALREPIDGDTNVRDQYRADTGLGASHPY